MSNIYMIIWTNNNCLFNVIILHNNNNNNNNNNYMYLAHICLNKCHKIPTNI